MSVDDDDEMKSVMRITYASNKATIQQLRELTITVTHCCMGKQKAYSNRNKEKAFVSKVILIV